MNAPSAFNLPDVWEKPHLKPLRFTHKGFPFRAGVFAAPPNADPGWNIHVYARFTWHGHEAGHRLVATYTGISHDPEDENNWPIFLQRLASIMPNALEAARTYLL